MKPRKDICAIIAAYNEEKTIGTVVQEARARIRDVVVIDDGSTDRTAEIAKTNGALVISHKINRGKGAALNTGFQYAIRKGYRGVITIDGDGQHLPQEIGKFIAYVDACDPDIVLGNRMQNPENMPFHRYLTNVFTSWVISRRCGQPVYDCQCGFRYISARVLSSIALKTKKFDSENEILMRASWNNFRIEHVPVTSVYFPKRESKIKPLRDTWRFFIMILRSFQWQKEALSENKARSNPGRPLS